MGETIKWGILGPGRIAHSFVKSLLSAEGAEIVAVGSRSKSRAEEFARLYGIPRFYGSYNELADDSEVDAIYVATPHSAHYEGALMCIKAGKAVLCEKSFTVNAGEAKELICAAKEKGVFLMEAMWTRYLPAIVKLRELLAQGIIGDVRMVKADFGYRFECDADSRLLNPALAGGALLDVGIYTVSFASMIFGTDPVKVTGTAHLGATNVDEQCAMVLGYDGGRMAVLSAAVRTQLPNEVWILGTKGRIRIPEFWHAREFELTAGVKTEKYEIPYKSTGYLHEAEEVMHCLREGKLESDIMPLEETFALMKIMDTLRAQWGLRYPFE